LDGIGTLKDSGRERERKIAGKEDMGETEVEEEERAVGKI
jgi:hypothetical protein